MKVAIEIKMHNIYIHLGLKGNKRQRQKDTNEMENANEWTKQQP